MFLENGCTLDPRFKERIRKECERSGQPLPDSFANEVDLSEDLHFYLDAWNDLASERQFGMGVGPIPFFQIVKYCKYYHLCEEMSYSLIKIVQAIDGWYLADLAKKAKK